MAMLVDVIPEEWREPVLMHHFGMKVIAYNTNCRFKSHKCVGSRPTASAVKTRIPGHFPAPPNAIGLLPNLEKTVLE